MGSLARSAVAISATLAALTLATGTLAQGLGETAPPGMDNTECTPHPPISIDGEKPGQGFTIETPQGEEFRPGSGVVGGDGTAENPYVIEGWCLVSGQTDQETVSTRIPDPTPMKPPRPAIQIENTVAHIEIRNNTITGTAEGERDQLPSPPYPLGLFTPRSGYVGIELADVHQIHIQDNRIQNNTFGIYGFLIDEITIIENAFTGQFYAGVDIGASTARVLDNTLDSSGIDVAGNDVVVAGNDVEDAGVGIDVHPSWPGPTADDPLVVRDNHVENTWAAIDPGDHVRIENNTLETGSLGVWARGSNDIQIRNTSITGFNEWGVELEDARNVALADNRLRDNNNGVKAEASDHVVLRHNEIAGNNFRGIQLVESSDVGVLANQIEDNIRGIQVDASADGHARERDGQLVGMRRRTRRVRRRRGIGLRRPVG